MEIKDFVGDADIKNEADLLMDMLNNVRVIFELSYLRVILSYSYLILQLSYLKVLAKAF